MFVKQIPLILFVFLILAVAPSLVSADTIILRSDDAMAWWSVSGFQEFHNMIQSRNIPVTVGVIPTSSAGYRLSTDSAMVSYLRSMQNTDLAQHGYMHDLGEFAFLTESEADAKIKLGKAIMIADLGETPKTFLSPYGETSIGTWSAIQSNGFIATGDYGNTDTYGENPTGLYHIPITVDAYDYGSGALIDIALVQDDCEWGLSTYGVCVIIVHFHYYLDASGSMTTETQSSLTGILDYIDTKRTSGTTLTTYAGYASDRVSVPSPPSDDPPVAPPVDLVDPPAGPIDSPAPPAIHSGFGYFLENLVNNILGSFAAVVNYLVRIII